MLLHIPSLIDAAQLAEHIADFSLAALGQLPPLNEPNLKPQMHADQRG